MDCGEGPTLTIHCEMLARHFNIFSNKYILMDKSQILMLLKYLALPMLTGSKLLQLLFNASGRVQHIMKPNLRTSHSPSRAARQVVQAGKQQEV